MRFISRSLMLVALGALLLHGAACGDDDGTGDGNEEEVITTVIVTFTPAAGGAPVVVEFDDPDGDGGAAPTVDPLTLSAGAYSATVAFQNRLETPPEEITDEVRDESDEHQVFFTGTAIDGPASDRPGAPLTHAYADTDENGLPIGLTNDVTAAAGTGDMVVTLRHLPPVNDQPVKTGGLADQVRAGGLAGLPGSTDVQVTFPVAVN